MLADFAKGGDATLALQAPSPPQAVLAKGRAALKQASEILQRGPPSPVPHAASNGGDERAAPDKEPALGEEEGAPDGPDVAPAKKRAAANKRAADKPPAEREGKKRPVGRPRKPADPEQVEESAQVAVLKEKHDDTVRKLEGKIKKLEADLKASVKNEGDAVESLMKKEGELARKTAELEKFKATAKMQIQLAQMRVKLDAAGIMLTGQQGGSSAQPTTPGVGASSSAALPTPNALAAFFTSASEE